MREENESMLGDIFDLRAAGLRRKKQKIQFDFARLRRLRGVEDAEQMECGV